MTLRRTGIQRGTNQLKRTGPIKAKRISIVPGKSSVNPLKPKRPKMSAEERDCKDIVKLRSGGVCEVCDSRRGQSVHHRRKQSQGGPWTASNTLHLCGTGRGPGGCHGLINGSDAAFYANGWLVYSYEDWTTKPVLRRGEWVLLDDEGGMTPSLPFEEAS